MLLRNISIAAAIAALLLVPVSAFAQKNQKGGGGGGGGGKQHRTVQVKKTVHVQKSGNVRINVNRHVQGKKTVYVVGRRYYGGIWYGPRRHYWNGRWYPYGVGACWLPTEIGYVWVCG